MSSDDAQDAYATLKPLIIALACETGFYVLSILSFAVSTYILAHKGFKTRANFIMWITTFIMFAVSTCHLVLQWIDDMNKISTQLSPAFIHSYFEGVMPSATVHIPTVNYLLSDAIVLWRVWIMWGRSVKVLIFPVLFSLSSLGAGVYISSGKASTVESVCVSVSTLGINLITTTLMAVKAWQYRQQLKSYLNDTEYRSQVGSVLALLVESGTLYCVIWIIFLVTWCSVSSKFNSTSASVLEILPTIAVQVSGIYPTAVIALVALQRTTWDMNVGKDMSQNAPRTEMRFTTRATRSGVSTAEIEYHHLIPFVDRGPHPHASEIAARDGEV